MTEFNFNFNAISSGTLNDHALTIDHELSEKLTKLFNQRFILALSKMINSNKTIVIQFSNLGSSIVMQAVVMFFSMHGLNNWHIVKNCLVIDASSWGWARIETLIMNI